MNKKRVNQWIPVARDALEICGVVRDGAIDRGYQRLVATFGAMLLSGSLRATVAYFCDRGYGGADRTLTLAAIYYCITRRQVPAEQVLDEVCRQDSLALKEQFVDATIAVKLAMGVFPQR